MLGEGNTEAMPQWSCRRGDELSGDRYKDRSSNEGQREKGVRREQKVRQSVSEAPGRGSRRKGKLADLMEGLGKVTLELLYALC